MFAPPSAISISSVGQASPISPSSTLTPMTNVDLSNKTGLHIYPLHTLQFNTESDEDLLLELLHKLQCFTIVHSKFVLLLQSLAHSSHHPVESELEENSPPRSTPQALQIPPPGIKQLYFPEPLYYCTSPAIHRTPSFHRHRRSQSLEVVTGESRTLVRKKTLLGRSRRPPPPPSSDFLIRQSYFSPWRRILQSSSITITEPATLPRRRRFLNASNWSDSSLSTSTRLSFNQEKRSSASVLRSRISPLSPHDIHLATSRSHAPILRAFVPCSELNDVSIAACEDQLADAGLWDHLSVGDVVCNLGYMPPLQPFPESDFLEDPVGRTSISVASQQLSPESSNTTDDTVWLVYDGFGLVQYSPAVEPPPLKDALTLVTPYYYSHIMPSPAHPFFTLDLYTRLSRFRAFTDDAGGYTFSPPTPPKFELITMLTKVRSPHSPGGYAVVKRYKWVVTIKVTKAVLSSDVEIGSGWLTDEWVLEVDGTLEGRRMLDSLVSVVGSHVASGRAQGDWVWEVDRQRSNSHKTWFRFVHFGLNPGV